MRRPIILLPVAGNAQRFLDAGITTPKPLIEVHGRTIVEWAMDSLVWSDCELIFVTLAEHEKYDLADRLWDMFGECEIVQLKEPTLGALCSCLEGTKRIQNKSQPLTIFTPDAMCYPLFNPVLVPDGMFDGFLSLYPSTVPTCSYARVRHNTVIQVAEKEVISPYATTGIYHFAAVDDFEWYAKEAIEKNIRTKGEFYIAPIYQLMINDFKQIGYEMVEKVDVLGTPQELEVFASGNSST